MSIKSIIIVFLSISAFCNAELLEQPRSAFICVPIADLIGKPINTFNIDNDTTLAYQKMPISFGASVTDKLYCPRIYQGLMHEPVTLLGYEGDEAIVAIHNMFYLNAEHPIEPQVVYYTHKSNVVPFDQLQAKRNTSGIALPEPISFNRVHREQTLPIVTLTLPFNDAITNQTYSAGTRFLVNGLHSNNYQVWTYETARTTFTFINIPVNICMPAVSLSKEQHINNFVSLLKLWTNLPQGFIPLVWGGCSFKDICTTDVYSTQTTTYTNGFPATYWAREGTTQPFSGFDTSALIARAAQICGIPYYFRNSYTAEKCLRPLAVNEPIVAGDLIWFQGYLGAITNIEEATIVGAMAYSADCGKVFEAPLAKLLGNITSTSDLYDAYINQKPLELVNSSGKLLRTINQFKILKLESAWDFTFTQT